MQFYIYLNGARRGPFNEEQMRSYIAAGLLQAIDLASNQPDGHLQPLSAFPNLNPPSPAARPPNIPAPLAPPRDNELPQLPTGAHLSSTLAPNETPFFRTSSHWIIFVRFGLLALAVFLLIAMPFAIAVQALTASQIGWFALPLPAFILVAPTLVYVGSELVITNERVLIKAGIIRRQTLEMFISKIESIAIEQSFLGRFLDYGTVVVRGTGGLEERFEAIARPNEFRNCVQRNAEEIDHASGWVACERKAAGPASKSGRLT